MDYWKALFTDGTRDANGGPDISASNTAAIVSILSAGTFFGSLSAAPFADFLGRRFALIASSVVFSFGVILQTAATAIPLFLAGRFFAGFGVGLVSALSMLGMCLIVGLSDML
jgi:MFS family permease